MVARHLVLNRLKQAGPHSRPHAHRPQDHLRVVFLSSCVHVGGQLTFKDLQLPQRYHGLQAYADSKLSSILAAKQFQQRLHRCG